MGEVLLKDEVFTIIGAAMEVHSKLGSGFLEAVYQEALEYEMQLRSIPYQAQQAIAIKYKDHLLQKSYVCDLLCFD
jgi:GxxExxY protein